MRPTLNALMEQIGIQVWPERWQDIYDTVMDDFEQNGCSMLDPAHIDALADRYGILNGQRELYKQVAAEISKQEPLGRLLALLCAALADTEHRKDDLKNFAPIFSTADAPNLGLNMLPGLALLSQMPECYNTLCALGLPEEDIRTTMQIPEATVGGYAQDHNGMPGFDLLPWYQRVIKGHYFRIGRLQVELKKRFRGRACVFRNKAGEVIALAHELMVHASGLALGSAGAEATEGAWEAMVEETEHFWEGYPFHKNGLVSREKVRLEKSQWKKELAYGDMAVGLHIPADGPMTPEAVQDSLTGIRAFLKKYYPEDADYHFHCNSWLINPKVISLLGEESNIAKFCKLFYPLTRKSQGTSVFHFVFRTDASTPVEELPEDTRLHRKLKELYLSGDVLHEMVGVILADN